MKHLHEVRGLGVSRYPTNIAVLPMPERARAAQNALELAHKQANHAPNAFDLLQRMVGAEESRDYKLLHMLIEEARGLLQDVGVTV